MDRVECVVIGAGVVGLAIARKLATSGREVIVLEAAEGIGTVTSSRNSEVIHAGIYYKAGSLRSSTPLACACARIACSRSVSPGFVATISLPQFRCGTPCSAQ